MSGNCLLGGFDQYNDHTAFGRAAKFSRDQSGDINFFDHVQEDVAKNCGALCGDVFDNVRVIPSPNIFEFCREGGTVLGFTGNALKNKNRQTLNFVGTF